MIASCFRDRVHDTIRLLFIMFIIHIISNLSGLGSESDTEGQVLFYTGAKDISYIYINVYWRTE